MATCQPSPCLSHTMVSRQLPSWGLPPMFQVPTRYPVLMATSMSSVSMAMQACPWQRLLAPPCLVPK